MGVGPLVPEWEMAGREGEAGSQARQLSTGALFGTGCHDSADLRPQLISLMGLNGPKCSQSLDRTHLEPAGGLAPVTARG